MNRITMLVAASAMFSCLAVPRAEAQAAQDLVGTWALVSSVVVKPGDVKVETFGSNPSGWLMFGSDGRYMLTYLRRDLPKVGVSQSFWRLPRVEPAGGICASEPEVAHDPERPCREAEAPVEGRFQGPALRGSADPAGRLLVPALPAQLSRHRGVVPGARPCGGPLHPEPLGVGLRAPDREEAAGLPQAPLRFNPGRRDVHQGPRPVALPVPGHRQARHARGLPAHGQARSRRGQAVLSQDAAGGAAPLP